MSELQYYVDGELRPASEATVSIHDRGFKYGDAAFETLRSYNGELFAWSRHLDRLNQTCELLSIDATSELSTLRSTAMETLAANDLSEAYVRVSITRGQHVGKLTPPSDTDPTVVIIVAELPRGGQNGTDVWDGLAEVEFVDTIRIPDQALPAAAKTHNYLNGIRARLETDADEALMLDQTGSLTEGATSNLFFCTDGTLKTPSLDGPVLPGITRKTVLDLATELGIPTDIGTYTPEELRRADEAFLTNSTWEIRPIGRIGDTYMDHGPITERLADAFDAHIETLHY